MILEGKDSTRWSAACGRRIRSSVSLLAMPGRGQETGLGFARRPPTSSEQATGSGSREAGRQAVAGGLSRLGEPCGGSLDLERADGSRGRGPGGSGSCVCSRSDLTRRHVEDELISQRRQQPPHLPREERRPIRVRPADPLGKRVQALQLKDHVGEAERRAERRRGLRRGRRRCGKVSGAGRMVADLAHPTLDGVGGTAGAAEDALGVGRPLDTHAPTVACQGVFSGAGA